jgi:hypothetical protein
MLAGACFALSSVWAVAGAFKIIFGVRITFPLLPPLDLDHVAPVPSLLVAFALMILGAWLGRTAIRTDHVDQLSGESISRRALGANEASVASRPSPDPAGAVRRDR